MNSDTESAERRRFSLQEPVAAWTPPAGCAVERVMTHTCPWLLKSMTIEPLSAVLMPCLILLVSAAVTDWWSGRPMQLSDCWLYCLQPRSRQIGAACICRDQVHDDYRSDQVD
jgi:hypothetical protein